MMNRLSLWILALGLTACATGPCVSKPVADAKVATKTEGSDKTSVLPEKIRVFKADGSKQCGRGQAIALDEMKKELKDIQVYSSYNKNDGQMRIQLCGSPTGNSNVFEINKSDLEKAQKAGFREWVFE